MITPPDLLQPAIGARFHAACGQLSNSRAAEALGISRESVRRYRKGLAAIPAHTLALACERFQVSPAWILLGKGAREVHATPSAEATGESKPNPASPHARFVAAMARHKSGRPADS
jgi:transcriptional regulator with XRE-family HTH domain